MPRPRVIILRAAGTNCDLETEHAWRLAGAEPQRVHLRRVLEQPATLDRFQVITFPGGFSFGDDLGAGTIFARRLHRRLVPDLRRFVERGGLILGICNGFQILVKAGILPIPAAPDLRACTITFNNPPGFQDRWVAIRGNVPHCAFLEHERVYEMPIAHGEGRILFANPESQRVTLSSGCAAAVYCQPPEQPSRPVNPNGSADDLAGLCDPTGRVFGLMPHPERHVEPTQHPLWTSRGITQHRGIAQHDGDGLEIFRRAVFHAAT